MTSNLSSFIDAVTKSRLLVGIQKKELLDRPELLPESYRARVITILNTFDEGAKKRDAKAERLTKEIASKYADK